jgi:glycyl-tRNA synthetase beta chain
MEAIRAVRPTENFEPLAASFKRIRNILKQAGFEGGISYVHATLEEGPEQVLCHTFERLRSQVGEAVTYTAKLEWIASLRPAVDLFFDKVLVNSPDPNVRRNRLALLDAIRTEFNRIADFSEIVTSD